MAKPQKPMFTSAYTMTLSQILVALIILRKLNIKLALRATMVSIESKKMEARIGTGDPVSMSQ
jgi:hypothetical protein